MVDSHSVHGFRVEAWLDPNRELFNGTRDIEIEELGDSIVDSSISGSTLDRNNRIPYMSGIRRQAFVQLKLAGIFLQET